MNCLFVSAKPPRAEEPLRRGPTGDAGTVNAARDTWRVAARSAAHNPLPARSQCSAGSPAGTPPVLTDPANPVGFMA